MVVLHIAYIDEKRYSGVNAVVPQFIRVQGKYATVALWNIYSLDTEGVMTFNTNGKYDIDILPEPFNNPDIVVFHELYRPPFLRIYKQIKSKNIPYVIEPHGGLAKTAQKKKRLKKFIGNSLFFNGYFNGASKIHYLSENEAKDSIVRAPYFVCGNGINIPERKKEHFNTDKIKIVYIGRIDINCKGLDILISAAEKCKNRLLESNCTIDIYGPESKDSKALGKLIKEDKLDGVVNVYDEVYGKEKEEILLSADCFIQASRYEGMPLGVLEALSYGVPCIVTEGTNMAETVRRIGAGWPCENNVSSLAETVLRMIEEKELVPSKSENCLEYIRDNFSWDKIAEETLKNYADTLR
ncbi:MAG: glycosyltransferase [Ruminococcaceae bacterium]|nr:glycosyltransferase [Oscillospiraceae bacterium]